MDAICSIIAATNVSALYSRWVCTTSGLTATNPCQWEGVNCNFHDEIVNVLLSRIALYGTIPAGIGNGNGFGSLTKLDFGFNILIGSIPDSIGNLSQLIELEIPFNSISGSLPLSLSNLALLETIDLEYNNLEGRVDAVIGNLPFARSIVFNNNCLTGSIPASLVQATGLELLNLSRNKIGGSIPSALGSCSAMVVLQLSNNCLTGSLPSSLGLMVSLNSLGLEYNWLTGTIPSSVDGLSAFLYEFDVSSNVLTGTLPSTLGQLTDVFFLDVGSNQFSGTVPDSLAELSKLQYFYLSENLLSGTVPTGLGNVLNFSMLQVFYIDSNIFTGSLPPNMSALPRLQYADVHHNYLNGSLPLFSSPQLLFMDASSNKFSGSIPSMLSTVLGSISVASNRFAGSLPANLGDYSVLHFFNTSYTNVGGNIPSSLCVSTSFSIDVSGTDIHCYSGCLTSTQVIVTGASSFCPNGSILQNFLTIVGVVVVLWVLFTVLHKHKASSDAINHYAAVAVKTVHQSCCAATNLTWPVCAEPDPVAKVERGSGKELRSFTVGNSLEGKCCNAGSGDDAKNMSPEQPISGQPAGTGPSAVIPMAFVKLLMVIGITMGLSDWWKYGFIDRAARNEVVESCSNPSVGNCYSLCGSPSVVQVQIIDDDFGFDDVYTPPHIKVTESSFVVSYCVAELLGSCAFDYWLAFKLVPLLLHVLQFLLQCFAWWWYKDFTPQQKQYDLTISYLYPEVNLSERSCDDNISINKPNECNNEDSDSANSMSSSMSSSSSGSITIAYSRHNICSSSNSISDIQSSSKSQSQCADKGKDQGFSPSSDNKWAHLSSLVGQLTRHTFFCSFSFIEVFTIMYVWGELQYPPVFCGSKRPLSLYYYPILMSLLDLTKFNVYVAVKHCGQQRFGDALFALLNLDMFLSNLWISVVLSVMFVVGLIFSMWTGAKSWFISAQSLLSAGDRVPTTTCTLPTFVAACSGPVTSNPMTPEDIECEGIRLSTRS